MKSFSLEDIKNSQIDDILIIKDNSNRFKLKYKNNDLIIDTGILFEKCNIFRQNGIPKIKMFLNNFNDFIETFRILYDNISYSIEQNDEIDLTRIINPVFEKNDIKMLFANVTSKTIIKNVENDKIMKLNEIENKTFNMYPVLYLLHMNLYDDNLYIIFSFHTIFIKILEEDNLLDINYEKIKKMMIN